MISGIIDVHAHILPGVDDGAKTMDETRRMLQLAYDQGGGGIIATPHYLFGGDSQSAEELREVLAQVQREAWSIDPEFQIYCGNEVLYFDGMAEDLKEGKILTLGDSRYVLTEFYDNVSFHEIYQGVRKVAMAGYRMVIAHVERYFCLREAGKLDSLIQAGAVIQMNYKSLEGGMFSSDSRWCRRQVLEGRVHLLGTDMHNTGSRAPEILQAVKWLHRKKGEAEASAILRDNAETILADKILELE